MKMLQPYLSKLAVGLPVGLAVVVIGTLAGCSDFSKAADVSGSVRTSINSDSTPARFLICSKTNFAACSLSRPCRAVPRSTGMKSDRSVGISGFQRFRF